MGTVSKQVSEFIYKLGGGHPGPKMARMMIKDAFSSDDGEDLQNVCSILSWNGWNAANLNEVLKEVSQSEGFEPFEFVDPKAEAETAKAEDEDDALLAQAAAKTAEAEHGVTEEKVDATVNNLVEAGQKPSRFDVREVIEAVAALDDPAIEEEVVDALSGLKWKKGSLNAMLKKAKSKLKVAKVDEDDDVIQEASKKLTDRYKYVKSTAGYYDVHTHEVYDASNVHRTVRHQLPILEDGTIVPAPNVMLMNPVSIFDQLTYRPECEDFAINEGVLRLLNTYRPSVLQPMDGDVSLIMQLVDGWFGDDELEKKYFWDTIAHQIQRPGIKQPHALVLQSEEGYGKGTLFTHILKLIVGGHNYVEPANDELASGKLAYLEGCILAVVNETMTTDRRELAPLLKQAITEYKIRVDRKFINTYEIENLALQVYCTNYDNALYISPSDRRFFFYNILSEKPSKAFFKKLHDWIKIEDGPAKLYHWLLERDLTGYDAYADPPMTDAKAQTIEDLRSEAHNMFLKMWEAEEGVFERDVCNLEELVSELRKADLGVKIGRNGVAQFLRKMKGGQISGEAILIPVLNKNGEEVTDDEGQSEKRRVRLFAIRDAGKWMNASRLELADAYYGVKRDNLVEDE